MNEVNAAVGKGGIDAAGVAAPGHGRVHLVAVSVWEAAVVDRTDAEEPELVTILELIAEGLSVGAVQRVVGRGVVVAAGVGKARAGLAHGPDAARVLLGDPGTDFVDQDGVGGSVGNIGDSGAILACRAHKEDRTFAQRRARRGKARDIAVAARTVKWVVSHGI